MKFIGYAVEKTKNHGKQNNLARPGNFLSVTEGEEYCGRQSTISNEMGPLINTRQWRQRQTVSGLMRQKENGSHDKCHGNRS